MVRLEGLEPSAYRLKGDYSTTELQPRKNKTLFFLISLQAKRLIAGCVFTNHL